MPKIKKIKLKTKFLAKVITEPTKSNTLPIALHKECLLSLVFLTLNEPSELISMVFVPLFSLFSIKNFRIDKNIARREPCYKSNL